MGELVTAVFENLGRWFRRNGRGITKGIALAVVIATIPFALLAMVPSAIGLFAPPLDNKVDLYSVNRPLAFTFLDADGTGGRPSRRRDRRAAAAERDAGLSACRVHRDGGPPLLRASRHRRARADARDVAAMCAPVKGGGRLDHHAADREDRLHRARSAPCPANGRNCSMRRSSRSRCPRSRSSSSISTASISAPALMAWTARRMSISTNPRAT